MRYFKHALAAAGLIWACVTASNAMAASVDYTYNSTCTSDCFALGLTDGTPVSGTMTFDNSGFGSNAVITTSSLLGFTFNIGSLSISNTSAAGDAFLGLLDSSGQNFSAFTFTASDSIFPSFGQLLSINSIQGSGYSSGGTCFGSSCFFSGGSLLSVHANLGAGTLTDPPGPSSSPSATAVPEPGTLALFASGLLGLGFVARRRRRQTLCAAA